MRRWLPPNVTEYKDRHGKVRYRFRKKGLKPHTFRNPPGTPEFLAELHEAQGNTAEKEPRHAPFTYDALIASYYTTARWIDSKDSTKGVYGGIIERFRADNGTKDVRRVTTANIEKKLAGMAHTPARANNLRKALSRLHRHAIKLGWRTDNPVTATDPFKLGKGFHPWSDEELAAFDARWPYGTRERLAKELLLNTALRKSDVLHVGPENRVGDRLELHHSKNNSDTSVQIEEPLLRALVGFESGNPYVQTQYGKPFTPTGFYNWFKRACVKAGIPHCSPHGIRKAISRQLAESGSTPLQGRAVTGHKTDAEFARYAESANRARMADAAMANRRNRLANVPDSDHKKLSDCND